MGIENMRRWPMYIVFGVSFILLLSLLNSWSIENDLQNKVEGLSLQLQECSKQQSTCMEESLTLTVQRDRYRDRVNELDKKKAQLNNDVLEYKSKVSSAEMRVNRTLVDVEFCKTELQSLKNLQESTSTTLETLRLEKDTITLQLQEKKRHIVELEAEIEKLKVSLTSKSAPNMPVSVKVTPAVQPPKISPSLNANNPINEPVIENNNAQEEIEDPNAINDGGEFDPQ